MKREEINRLISQGKFPEATKERKLIETHISWVILCDEFVYKIKKPIQYSFLDFSTLKLRSYFCQRELELNRRFSNDIYLEILPIHELQANFSIGGNEGTVVDYALKMRKLDPEKQMDVLIFRNKVSKSDIKNLAQNIANFHSNTAIVYKKDVLDVKEKFNDLGLEKKFLSKHLGSKYGKRIDHAIQTSNAFLSANEGLLNNRLHAGFFRDCHGDLHTRNIFLLPEPQLFDCIEFNDDYRHIDVLNEVAFLCMDLDAMGKKDLSSSFIEHYNHLFQAMRTNTERQLFIYYKCYRANVRAKVNSLRAKSTSEPIAKQKALAEAVKYLMLMQDYIKLFRIS